MAVTNTTVVIHETSSLVTHVNELQVQTAVSMAVDMETSKFSHQLSQFGALASEIHSYLLNIVKANTPTRGYSTLARSPNASYTRRV